MMGRVRQHVHGIFYLVYLVAAVAALFCLAEGLSSIVLAVRTYRASSQQAFYYERTYTKYDAELGWTTVPGYHNDDYFGKGLPVTINPEGFRGAPLNDAAAGPTLRVACFGDSFTFGDESGDESVWVRQLEALRPGVKAINGGVSAYGLDQIYLRYLRESPKLKAQHTVVSIILDDILRMRKVYWWAYPKPRLAVRENRLVTENVPVPARDGVRAPPGALRALTNLRMVELLSQFSPSLDFTPVPASLLTDDEMREVIDKILFELQERSALDHSKLLFVIFPTGQDFIINQDEKWREVMLNLLAKHKIPTLDMIYRVRGVPPGTAATFFTQGLKGGHFTVGGNQWVAGQIAGEIVPER